MPWTRRPVPAAIAALATLTTVVLLAGCSSDDAGSPSSTTTGIADPITTTTAPESGGTSSPGEPRSEELPGLWLATPAGITDETGDVWAAPAAGETLRSPLSDGVGGVVYLRCVADALTCAVEDAQVKGAPPLGLGDADRIFAVGTVGERSVLVTSWTDPTIVPSFEENRSGVVARLIDIETKEVTTLPDWFGWESGPFVAAVEQGRFVVCSGEGEMCGFASGDDPNLLVPLDSVEPATVMSLALDDEATRATWIEAAPMTGQLDVHVLDITTGTVTTTDLQAASAQAPDDSVTDGSWVAVRTGAGVVLSQLTLDGAAGLTGNTGTRTVPDGVTDMAIREPVSGGGGPGLSL